MISSNREKGQAIVLIIISMVGLIAMAALIVDGGNSYLNRRRAQTAADAAALAAANALCVKNIDSSNLQPIVDEYAVNQNGATDATYTFSLVGDADEPIYPKGKVTVTTRIIASTFFARVFNRTEVEVRAIASAGCFLPGAANNLLPVAWTCRHRDGGSTNECVITNIPHIDWDAIRTNLGDSWFSEEPALPTDPLHVLDDGTMYSPATYYDNVGEPIIYLVMDEPSFVVETYCEEYGGTINCDFDNDGILDVEGGADRGWLLLDGNGAVDLSNLMINGYDQVLELPQWFPGKSGVANSVFINAHSIKFRINLIPVFNAICEDTTEENLPSDCSTDYNGTDLIRESSGDWTYYRVPAVAAFVVTCVSKGNSEYCPGKDLAGLFDDPQLKHTSTIEGYFINGYNFNTQIGSGGFDLGVYVLSLTE